MSHTLSYPTTVSPTHLVVLHPALVTIQDHHNVEPYQRLLEASDGTHYSFQVTTNLRVLYRVEIVELHQTIVNGFAGLDALYIFFASGTMWGLNSFVLSHDNGYNVTVRLAPPWWSFTETRRGRYTGTLTFIRVP
jgi:hypothetical protein